MSFQRKFASSTSSSRERNAREVSTPTVLLIEDSPVDTQIFEHHLRKVALHWRFKAVHDGFTGIRHMTLHGFPSLLVTRLNTPRFGALDIAEWIRSMKTPGLLPVMIYDKTVQPDFRRQLAEYYVTEYLEKHSPVESFQSQLRRMVESVEKEACRRRSQLRNRIG